MTPYIPFDSKYQLPSHIRRGSPFSITVMSSFTQADCRRIFRKFLEVAGAKRCATWYVFGLPEEDNHSIYSFCRVSSEKLDQFMGLCGLAAEINGVLCLKRNLLYDFFKPIINVEHSFTELSGCGYTSKKYHCIRIGSLKKGSAPFDMKKQLLSWNTL